MDMVKDLASDTIQVFFPSGFFVFIPSIRNLKLTVRPLEQTVEIETPVWKKITDSSSILDFIKQYPV